MGRRAAVARNDGAARGELETQMPFIMLHKDPL
jgi:hypothetical protein